MHIVLTIIFHFPRSVEVKINRDHTFQVPVSARVTDVTIEPSSSVVTLSQHPLSTHNTHLQGSLTLYNPHTIPARFSWDLNDHLDYLMVSNPTGMFIVQRLDMNLILKDTLKDFII